LNHFAADLQNSSKRNSLKRRFDLNGTSCNSVQVA
jgi:hypothetical protein